MIFPLFFLRLCSGQVRHIQAADHPFTRKKQTPKHMPVTEEFHEARAGKFGVVG